MAITINEERNLKNGTCFECNENINLRCWPQLPPNLSDTRWPDLDSIQWGKSTKMVNLFGSYLVGHVVRGDVVGRGRVQWRLFRSAAELQIVVLTHGQSHAETQQEHGGWLHLRRRRGTVPKTTQTDGCWWWTPPAAFYSHHEKSPMIFFLIKKKRVSHFRNKWRLLLVFHSSSFLFRWRVGRNEEWRWCEVFLSFWNKSNKRTNIRIIVGGMNDRSSGRPYRRIFFHFLGFFFSSWKENRNEFLFTFWSYRHSSPFH